MKTNNVTYVEKNQMNCEWLEGIPNSSPICIRSIGLGSLNQYFNNLLLISFISVPIKNAICKYIVKYDKFILYALLAILSSNKSFILEQAIFFKVEVLITYSMQISTK